MSASLRRQLVAQRGDSAVARFGTFVASQLQRQMRRRIATTTARQGRYMAKLTARTALPRVKRAPTCDYDRALHTRAN